MDVSDLPARRIAALARVLVRSQALLLALAIFVLAAPVHAQPAPGEFCTYLRKESIAGRIVDQFHVMRCSDGDRDATLRVVDGGNRLTLAAAVALRSTLAFANQPPVWCVGQRRNPELGITEATKARADATASWGMGVWSWTCDLTSSAADAMLTAIRLAPANQARTACVMWRRFGTPAGVFFDAFVVLQRHITAGIAHGFPEIRCNLTFAGAVALEAALEAANPPGPVPPGGNPPAAVPPVPPTTVTPLPGHGRDPHSFPLWCVIERTIPFGGQSVRQAAAIMCTNFERAGPGWVLADGPAPAHGAVRAASEVNDRAVTSATAASCRGALAGSVPTARAENGSYRCVCPAGTMQTAQGCAATVTQPQPQPQPPVGTAADTPPRKEEPPARPKKEDPPRPGALAMSGPVWVQKNRRSGSSNEIDSAEYSPNAVRLLVESGKYRREITWIFSAPPATLAPGQEFTITINGSARISDNGKPGKLGTAPSATVYHKGLIDVKKQHAWHNGETGQPGAYVFRVPEGARGATIYFQADHGSGTFANYRYGDHK